MSAVLRLFATSTGLPNTYPSVFNLMRLNMISRINQTEVRPMLSGEAKQRDNIERGLNNSA